LRNLNERALSKTVGRRRQRQVKLRLCKVSNETSIAVRKNPVDTYILPIPTFGQQCPDDGFVPTPTLDREWHLLSDQAHRSLEIRTVQGIIAPDTLFKLPVKAFKQFLLALEDGVPQLDPQRGCFRRDLMIPDSAVLRYPRIGLFLQLPTLIIGNL
jgi:hypothetical protein